MLAAAYNGYTLLPNKQGPLTIFREPLPGHFYVIGADVGSGRRLIEQHRGDPSCAEVVDYHNLEQVAEWHGAVEPDVFGDVLAHLGHFYNTAFIAVEANSEGSTTVHELARKMLYPRLYYRESPGSDRVSYNYPGWYTTSKNKSPMVMNLARHIRDWTCIIHGRGLIDELMSFVLEPTARGIERYRAEKGCRDDRVMAFGIALAARDSWQCMPQRQEESSTSVEDDRASRMQRLEEQYEQELEDRPYIVEG